MVVIIFSSVQILVNRWRSGRRDGGDRQPGSPLPTSGQSVSKLANWKRKAPAQRKAMQTHEIVFLFIDLNISCLWSDLPGGGTELFLAGGDHAGYGIVKWTRRYLPDTAVSSKKGDFNTPPVFQFSKRKTAA